MPLPSDEKLIALSQDLLGQFDTIFGLHPGFRPAHARGTMLAGTFTPSLDAASLTRAPHIARASTPVTARFSNATGLPLIPDNDPNANPRGLAIRFHLAERVHTDIICHSTDGFPTRTGPEFLEFLRAAASSDPDIPRKSSESARIRPDAEAQSVQLCKRIILRGDRAAFHQQRWCEPLWTVPDQAGRGHRTSG